jgi:hypothetical protein
MVSAANGVDYAFRELGDGAVPLVLLQHFRGNLDYWDPALIDALAVRRQVILFDNAGVGSSSGTTPSTVTQMARDAIAFLAAIDLDQVDILGYSLGSFIDGHHGARVVRDIDVQSGVHLLTGVTRGRVQDHCYLIAKLCAEANSRLHASTGFRWRSARQAESLPTESAATEGPAPGCRP